MLDTSAADTPCPLWRRLIALVYDLLAVVALVMVVGLLCQGMTHGQLIVTGAQVTIAWWYQPLQALVVAGYFVLSWLRGGQTLGMRPWHIRVTARDGAAVSVRQAIIRVVVAALPLLLLGCQPLLGLKATLWVLAIVWSAWFAVGLFDPRRRALHDLVAGTEMRQFA